MTEPSGGPPAWPELHEAQRAVLVEMIVHGSSPRAELARTLGLSRASLTRLTRELMAFGFIEEDGSTRPSARGRPPAPVDIRKDAAHFVGVKLTGEALYAVVTNLASEVIADREVPIVDRGVEAVVRLIAGTADDLLAGSARPGAIGVCLAGEVEQIDGERQVVDSYFLGWQGTVPLAGMVAEATGLPTTVSNDVQALTAAHHWFGGGVGRRSLVVIGVGAGIGAGLVVADRLVEGAHDRQGKIGHIIVDAPGEVRCSRGHRGCANELVTMRGIVANAGAADYPAVLAAARSGDAVALRAFEGAATALGAVVAQYANVLAPEKVIVTGEGIDMIEFARPAFDAALADRLDPRATPTLELEFPSFRFADYAWGAAITAIRDRV